MSSIKYSNFLISTEAALENSYAVQELRNIALSLLAYAKDLEEEAEQQVVNTRSPFTWYTKGG